jgi:four helix bundle protein
MRPPQSRKITSRNLKLRVQQRAINIHGQKLNGTRLRASAPGFLRGYLALRGFYILIANIRIFHISIVTYITAATMSACVILRRRATELSGTYKDLEAWQRAMALVTEIYRETAQFPREEMFGLTSQMRRAAISIPSNIAEGKGRFSDRELGQFLAIARGSVFEVETQTAIALNLGFLTDAQAAHLASKCGELGRLLNGLFKAVRKPAD